jgi:hypothetical protein
MNDISPSEETLRVKLELLWKDLFHVRNQTWRTLEIEVILVVGLIAADLNFRNIYISNLLAAVALVSVFAGLTATIHHRRTQIRILTHINHLEKALGLVGPNYIDNVIIPIDIHFLDILNPKATSTPHFILRMHAALLLFTLFYMVRFLLL